MSYYNNIFDIEFKKRFSQSYAEFHGADLKRLVAKILNKVVSTPSSRDKWIVESLIPLILETPREYNVLSYTEYEQSRRIIKLFDTCRFFERISGVEQKKAAALFYYRNYRHQKTITAYVKKENLPQDFANLAQRNECVKVLTAFFLKRCIGVRHDSKILGEVEDLGKVWIENTTLETPYERTGHFQCFLHQVCKDKNGLGSELNIQKTLIRIILSTARLHFSYMDEMHGSIDYLSNVVNRSLAAANDERQATKNQSSLRIVSSRVNSRKLIKNWRLRHLLPIFSLENDIDNSVQIIPYLNNIDSSDNLLDLKFILIAGKFLDVSELEDAFEDVGYVISRS